MLGAGMAPGIYVAGSLSLVAVGVVLAYGAVQLRRALLPDWSGAPARLAETVIVLGVVIGVAQVLGTFGWFRRVPLLVAGLFAGTAMAVIGRRRRRRRAPPQQLDRPSVGIRTGRREEFVIAALACGVVTAAWVADVAFSFGRGMTHGDTLWYHAPFAARFVQTGWLTHASNTGLSDIGTPLHGSLPLNGSLAQAIVMLPFHDDFLSPLLNVGFFALALLAGWCIGRRRGVGALCVLGTVVMLGLPTIVGTQPGQASNDVVTAALFLAGIALLFEGGIALVPTTLAAVAAGLAVGTKLTVGAALAALTIGVVVLALRARRPLTAVAWCLALAVSGSYWFVRDWVVIGSPLPWSKLAFGPLHFRQYYATQPGIASQLGKRDTWSRFVLPAFAHAFGRGWFAVLAIAIGGAALGVLQRGRAPIERVAGGATLVGVAAFPFIPFGGFLGGGAFVFTVRYLLPELLVGAALLVLGIADAPVLLRRGLLAVLAALVVLDVTSPYIEGIPLWPANERGTAIAAGFAVVIAAVVLAATRMPRRAATLVVGGVALAAACLGAGWFVQRHYFQTRYVNAGLPYDRINAWFRHVHGARVALAGSEHFYPLFGLDLSNRVSRAVGPVHGSAPARCRAWRRSLAGFDYLVLAHELYSTDVPVDAWISTDPAARLLLRDGTASVYRLRRPLDPAGC